jgi:hypothetical protein
LNLSRTSGWLPIATNLAVLFGLLLVVYELNQNSTLARVALKNEGTVTENQVWQALMNDAPNDVIAKSVECPERLTYSDYIVLDSYLFTALNNVYRNYEVAKEGLFTQSDWKSEVEGYAHWYLGDEFARTYWDKVGKAYFDPEFADYVDEYLAKEGIGMYGAWKIVRSNMKMGQESELLVSPLCR